jgi:hypothetical protein
MKNYLIKLLGGYTKDELNTTVIKNKEKKSLEAVNYWRVPVLFNDKIDILLFTDSDMAKATLRASKNKEDLV